MAVQYAGGTNVYTTIAADTRTLLVDNLKVELVNAGWSVASGASGDWKLNSATTPAGHNMRVRLLDPGSGNCAQITIMNQAETLAPTQIVYLLPAAAKEFTVVANKYQCFVYVLNSVTSREFAAFGVLCVPDGLNTAQAAWLMGNATGDADTDLRYTFRNSMSLDYGSAAYAVIWAVNQYSGTAAGVGSIRLRNALGANPNNRTNNAYRWHDDTTSIDDAIVAWGAAAYTDEGKFAGFLWDAIVSTGTWVADSLVTYDAKQFIAITDNGAIEESRGTLFVYAPA